MNKKTSFRSKSKVLYFNRRLRYEYFCFAELEAGIVLNGDEIRALIKREFDVEKSYVDFSSKKNPEVFWENANFANSLQKRKLLLHRKEILRWLLLKNQKKAIIVLQKIYFRNYKIKLKIILAKRKKKYEKRQKLISEQHSKDLEITSSDF